MLSPLHRRPPSGGKGEDQAGGGDEAGQNGGSPGFVGGGTSGIDGLIDTFLGLLLRDPGTLRHELGEIGAIFSANRTASNRPSQEARDLRTNVVRRVRRPCPWRRGGGASSRDRKSVAE